MVNSGFIRPQSRIVINLAPAELPKQAASFDLPISLCMLACSGQFSSEILEEYAVVGELSLEGQTRPVKGALSMAIAAAKREGSRASWYQLKNAPEAAIVEDIEVIPVSSLCEAVGFFSGQLSIDAFPSRLDQLFSTYSQYDVDYADVRGQEMVKRALCLAAAGGHNLLMLGPQAPARRCWPNDSNHSAATHRHRIDRNHTHLQRVKDDYKKGNHSWPNAVPLTPSYDQRCGPCRWWQPSITRRNFNGASWRALP